MVRKTLETNSGYRCTLLSRKWHTALSAASTRSTKYLSTRKAKIRSPHRVSVVTAPSRRDSEVRPSPSSARRPRPPRRLHWSLSAAFARSADASPSADANHSFLERRKTRTRAVSHSEHFAVEAPSAPPKQTRRKWPIVYWQEWLTSRTSPLPAFRPHCERARVSTMHSLLKLKTKINRLPHADSSLCSVSKSAIFLLI